MAKIKLAFLIIVFSTTSCQEKIETVTNKEQHNIETNLKQDTSDENVTKSRQLEFEEYNKKINSISLPVSLSCEVEYLKTFNQKNVDNSFAPPGGSSPVKIVNNKKLNLIIYHFAADIYFPILYSYNAKGKKIDSLLLLNGACNGDEYYNSNCYTQIDKNLNFILTDTAEHYSLINDGEDRILDSITLEKQQYKLNTKGKFELVSKKMKKIN